MSTPCPRRISSGLFLLLGVLLWLAPGLAAAQRSTSKGRPTQPVPGMVSPMSICIHSCAPPTVSIAPTSGSFTAAAQSVTIHWCGQAALQSTSRSITLGGVSVTSSFTYATGSQAGCTNAATSTGTVTLAAGPNVLGASINDVLSSSGSASAFYTYVPPANGPVVSTAPHNGTNLDVTKCLADCLDFTLTQATPTYTSLDVARALAFVYRDRQATPVGTVTLDVRDTAAALTDTTIGLKVLDPNGAVVNDIHGHAEIYFYNQPGATLRLSSRFSTASQATGAYTYSAVVTSYYSNGTSRTTTTPFRLLVVNESASRYGAGWTLAGHQRLYPQSDGGMVLTDGTGTVQYYAGPCATAPCTFTSPAGEYSVLSRHTLSGGTVFDRRTPDGSVASFSSAGYEIYVEDRFGNQTTYGYDGSMQLTGITDPVSKSTAIASAGTSAYGGPALTVTDPASRVTHLNLNAAGDLVTVQDPAGGTPFQGTAWSGHLLGTWTDRRGGQWDATYDCASHLSAISAPTVTAGGTAVRPVTAYANPAVATTGCTGGHGASTAPATAIRSDSVRAIITNPRGYATRYTLDRFGAPTCIEDALGRIALIWRDSVSRDTLLVSPSGHAVSTTWSGTNVTKIVDNTTGKTINYTYDSRFNLLTSVLGHTDSIRTYLNTTGTLVDSVKSASAVATRFKYDSRGRDTLTIDPEQHATHTRYESTWGNADTVATGGGRQTTSVFDGAGRTSEVRDALGHRSKSVYDVLNRVQYAVGPRSDTTWFVYDSLFLWKVRDAKAQVYQYDHNALGWVDSLADPGGRVDRYAYDLNGNVTRHINRRADTVSTTYDTLDRPLQLLIPSDTARTTTFAYDPGDGWSAASNAASVDTIRFDIAGRTVAEISRRPSLGLRLIDTTQYLDPVGTRRLSDWGSGMPHATVWEYDGALQLADILTNGAYTNFAHNNDRQASTVAFPNGVTQSNAYSSIHGRTETTFAPSGSAADDAFAVSASEDSLGRISERFWHTATGDTSRVYSYDAAGQLTGYLDHVVSGKTCVHDVDHGYICDVGASAVDVREETYSYDLVGNRTDSAGTIAAGNRIQSFHGYALSYDADGNLIKKAKVGVADSLELEWNALGELTRVRRGGVLLAEYAYDGFGRRVTKRAGGAILRYQWDGDNVVAERDSAGTVLTDYHFYPGIDHPHSVTTGGSNYFVATEPPGNVIGLMSASGSGVQSMYRYTPFGEMERNDTNTANSLRFQGRPYDAETGLYYFRARYYDPTLARFVSEDPIGLEGGINQYAFGDNDPINRRDPLGLASTTADGWSDWPFSLETFFETYVWRGGEGGSGGGGSNSKPEPDVVKNPKRVMACNRSANTVMAALQRNFNDFASFSSSFAPALTFNAPSQLRVGTSISISMFAPINGTVISYNTSVTVQSMSPTSLTFATVPGHALYPGTISFSASGAGQSQIQFGVDIRGNFANIGWRLGYNAGGSLFEDAVWSNLMDNVATFCGSKQ